MPAHRNEEMAKWVGHNIRKFRKLRGMTQKELAEKAGYTNDTAISRIENGLWFPSDEKLKVLADILQTTPGVLMGYERSEDMEREQLRQQAFDEFNTLFSTSSHVTAEQMKSVLDYLRFIRGEEKSDN